jgi:multimeric flavodoxin WrbA
MKIVALIASYRKNGNTARITRMIEAGLRRQVGDQEALDFEMIFLGQSNIQLCQGCRVCFNREEAMCPIKDDLLAIKAKLQTSDVIIAASPVYVDDISGTMKNWIDRMAHLCHRPGFAGKSVFLLATTGSTPTGRALETLTTAFSTWGAHIMGQAGFVTGALMRPDELETRYQAKTQAIAAQILRAIRGQAALYPTFRSLITFKIQQLAWQREKEESYDLSYWRERGWMDARRDYYIPHRGSRLKTALARLAGSLMAPFFIRN